MKRKIILSGELGKRYGKVHELAVKTPAEAIRAFCANYPDFAKWLTDSADRNIAYKVFVAKRAIMPEAEIHDPSGQGVIRFAPVIMGAKRGGFGTFILGAALIGASFLLPTAPLFAGLPGALGAVSYSSIAFGLGASLALGGISQLLTPLPKAQSPSERPENKPSYVFDGPVNTNAQGQAVPIGYGRLIIGSAVISAGITSDNVVSV